MRDAVRTEAPLLPVYPFSGVGEPIELYSGPISVGDADPLPGRVWVDVAGDLQVRWSVSEPEWLFEKRDVDLQLDLPGLGPTSVPARINDATGSGRILDADLGPPGAKCDCVITHFTNLPSVFPWGWGRWQLSGAGWELTLQGRPGHPEIFGKLTNSLFFAVTHVGELRRTDGSSFPSAEANGALEAFQVALSFALGRYVAPIAPVGFDAAGHRVWQQWVKWRCDPVSGYLPWWHKNDGEDLQAFVKLFVEAWFNRDLHGVMWHPSRHLIAAHHRGTPVEAKIMLVHAALEYLSWVTYVLSGTWSKTEYNKEPAGHHLRNLLTDARIETAIPSHLTSLHQYAEEEELEDGPGVLARLRNRLVHPKDPDEPSYSGTRGRGVAAGNRVRRARSSQIGSVIGGSTCRERRKVSGRKASRFPGHVISKIAGRCTRG
jgi:hypothetical protein